MTEQHETNRTPGSFRGASVVQFESRRAEELAGLIRRQGGLPWLAPALSEVPIVAGPEVGAVLDRLVAGEFELVVLLTGVGTRRLLEEAERIGRLEEARLALGHATTVCRGPKPVFALKQHGLKAGYLAREPQTTVQLLELLAVLPLSGRHALVVSAGEQMPEPLAFLRAHGARAVEIQLYRWDLTPSAAERLGETVRELIEGRLDAAVFTTQVQVRHLFDVARRMGADERLTEALRGRLVVGAVGPTSAEALRERGIEPDVVPEHPRMGHLVVAMARSMAAGAHRRSGELVADTRAAE